MAVWITIPGYYDTARSAPFELTRYRHTDDLAQPLTLGGWTAHAVYVNDLRLQNGEASPPPGTCVGQALSSLRAHARQAAGRMLAAPDGMMDGRRPHVTGGGWVAPGGRRSLVTFYVARNPETSQKFLCANVYHPSARRP